MFLDELADIHGVVLRFSDVVVFFGAGSDTFWNQLLGPYQFPMDPVNSGLTPLDLH
jgi:hypothetical protein